MNTYKQIIKALHEAKSHQDNIQIPKTWKLNSDGTYDTNASVKLNRTNISEATCIFYTIIVAYTFYDWTINKDELNKLQKYNKIIDLSIDLNQDYYQKEKGLGVRIDIWTHFMRGCIIDYVH